MAETRRSRWQERGTTTLEYVGIAVATAMLLAGVGTRLASDGGAFGEDVGRRLQSAVELAGPEGARRPSTSPGMLAAEVIAMFDGRARTWSERRASGGSTPLHVPRDDLRLTPVLPTAAVWKQGWTGERRGGGVVAAADARGCMLCAAVEWSRSARSGVGHTNSDRARGGSEVDAAVEARLVVASVDAGARLGRDIGPALVSLQARTRAMIGAELVGRSHLTMGSREQELNLHGSAMTGASVRAEGKIGVDLLGVAITQSGRAEGWAGAGIRGVAQVHHVPGKFSWRFGWGAALGLGGATEWSGSVDISHVPKRHVRLARDALVTATRVSGFGVLPLVGNAINRHGD